MAVYQQGGGGGFLSDLLGTVGGVATSYLSAQQAQKEAERLRRETEQIRERDFSRELERLKVAGGLTNVNVKYLAFGMLGLGAVLMMFKMVR